MTNFYKEEVFPEHIKYVKNTPENIEILNNILGVHQYPMVKGCSSYIMINLKAQSWRPCFDYAWLYRNPPPLIEVSDLGLEKPSYKGENPFKEAVKQLIKFEKEDMELEINEIKKALYKQKPIAEYGYEEDKHVIYSTEIVVEGVEEEITFKIPMDEVYDGDGNKIFNKEEPAQLLIRWLVIPGDN